MAKVLKLNCDGSEIKVRRLYWGERKKLKQEKLLEPENFEDCMDAVLNLVVEPKEAVDRLDMDEVQKIFGYAMGMRDEIEEKN